MCLTRTLLNMDPAVGDGVGAVHKIFLALGGLAGLALMLPLLVPVQERQGLRRGLDMWTALTES